MAVTSKKEGTKLILELDNGDLKNFKEVFKKWSFLEQPDKFAKI